MVRDIVRYLKLFMAGLQGLVLLPLFSRTLGRMWSALQKQPNGDTWAFGPMDAGFRPWYNKLARDYRRRGRFGFAWDDGLGISLGARIYANWATYWLLDRLGTRWMAAVGWGAFSVVCGATLGVEFGLIWGVAGTLLMAGSPLVCASYTHKGKPELIWWPLVLVITWAAFTYHPIVGGLLWSVLAFVNVPVAAMVMLVTGPAFWVSVGNMGVASTMLGALPGFLKLAIRFYDMWRTGFFGTLAGEQSRLWKRQWLPTLLELPWMILFGASALLSAHAMGAIEVGILLALCGVGLYWVNHRLLYMNDPQSYHLCFLAIGTGFAASGNSVWGLVPLVFIAYAHPAMLGVPTNLSRGESTADEIFTGGWQVIRRFPDLEPMTLPTPSAVMEFFSQIPDGSRLLAESDGDPRTESRYRYFWVWTEDFLPERSVDLVNEIYTRLVEPELVDRYLNNFRLSGMSGSEMRRVARSLGISHIVAFSSECIKALEDVGYVLVERLDIDRLGSFRELLKVPDNPLFLMEDPGDTKVVTPGDNIQRTGSSLLWRARRGSSHQVRYRYHEGFRAWQGKNELDISPYVPFPDIDLAFTEVRSVEPGLVRLSYDPGRLFRWGVRG